MKIQNLCAHLQDATNHLSRDDLATEYNVRGVLEPGFFAEKRPFLSPFCPQCKIESSKTSLYITGHIPKD